MGWISVNDDLPEYGQHVVWYDVNKGMYVQAKKKTHFPLPKTVTHWHEFIFPELPYQYQKI